MRYYTFTRVCGHNVRSSSKAKYLSTVCNDCMVDLWNNLDKRTPIPTGFGLWSEKLAYQWLKQHQKKS